MVELKSLSIVNTVGSRVRVNERRVIVGNGKELAEHNMSREYETVESLEYRSGQTHEFWPVVGRLDFGCVWQGLAGGKGVIAESGSGEEVLVGWLRVKRMVRAVLSVVVGSDMRRSLDEEGRRQRGTNRELEQEITPLRWVRYDARMGQFLRIVSVEDDRLSTRGTEQSYDGCWSVQSSSQRWKDDYYKAGTSAQGYEQAHNNEIGESGRGLRGEAERGEDEKEITLGWTTKESVDVGQECELGIDSGVKRA
ncbi:hypothetical protein Tco_0932990 [Tanacetum coccineum]